MLRRERPSDMAVLPCPCGYGIPPPWTPLNEADHAVTHLCWEMSRRDPTPDDWVGLAGAYERLVAELRAMREPLQRQIVDLQIDLAAREYDLNLERHIVADLQAELEERWLHED